MRASGPPNWASPHTAAQVDVTDEASVERLFGETGPLDVVVNCAGFGSLGLITDLSVDEFRGVVDVCLNGSFIVAKYAGQKLREGGSLVSISSLNGRQPAIGMSAYCSAKAGLSMLTQVAAMEWGPRGIRVNAVAPGFVDTPLDRGVVARARPRRGLRREHRARTRGHAGGDRRRGGVPLLAEVLMADRRGPRPQRRRTPETVSGCAGSCDETARKQHMSFAGKHAIVTGAGSGIGAALCRALVNAGADVVCTDIDGDAAQKTAAGLGDRARAARLDVTDAAAVQAVVDEVVSRAGRLDLMFNNAGICLGR